MREKRKRGEKRETCLFRDVCVTCSFPAHSRVSIYVLKRRKQDLIVFLLGAVLHDVQHRLQHGGQHFLRLQFRVKICPDVLIPKFLRKTENARVTRDSGEHRVTRGCRVQLG